MMIPRVRTSLHGEMDCFEDFHGPTSSLRE
jgi:hypothetical protein